MPESNSPTPDLWSVDLGRGMGGIHLDATVEDVVQSLKSAKIDLDGDDELDDGWLYVVDLDTELRFKSTQPPTLLEIIVEDEHIRLGPLPVIGERLHTIVEQLQIPDTETVWRVENDDDKRSTGGNQPIVTDESLLRSGTLWIPSLGLGLGMVRGEITTVRLRRPEESPRQGLGSLTPSQRELSKRKDLPLHLIRTLSEIDPTTSRIQSLLLLTVFAAMGMTVWQGIRYQAKWNAAPVVEGNVIDVKPPPPDPFPDEYTVEYHDQTGKAHQVLLKRPDVYVTPKVGEKIEIRYLPETPDRALGPARYRDAAFDKYIPIGIGIFATYLILLIIIPLAALVIRRARGPTRAASTNSPPNMPSP
jgi:hypothetical protein